MAKQRLTDRDDISGVTLTDLLHFVVTGDTSQNPAGSSFKGNVEQLFDAFSSYTCTNPLIVETVNACSSGITINGNVTINGSATTINTEVIQSKDNNIILNYSGTHLTALNGGITVEDGQSNGVDSVLYIDSDGCWHADPGFCDLTVDGIPFTGQTPYLFVENGTVNSITTRYSGNTITTSDYSNILGGKNNTTTSNYSTIAGGQSNQILQGVGHSFIAGGNSNIMSNSKYSVIGGGGSNALIYSNSANIGGGYGNTIDAPGVEGIGWINSIVGGYNNQITGLAGFIGRSFGSFIGNGGSNSITASTYSSIVGGQGNKIYDASSQLFLGPFEGYSSIGGGKDNRVSSRRSLIGGGSDNIIHKDTIWSLIGGGSNNSIYNNLLVPLNPSDSRFPNHQIIGGGQGNYIGGYTGFFQNQDKKAQHSIIGGGLNQSSYASRYSVIAGGYSNSHYFNEYGFIGAGGNNETIFAGHSNIVGGRNNYVRSSYYSSIVGGHGNQIDSDGFLSLYQFIGGGKDNKLFGNTSDGLSNSSSIVGGEGNIISATTHSLIGGGQGNNINSIDDGGTSDARHQFIGGGKDNKLFNITTTGGAKLSNYSSVIGGEKNVISASTYSLIGGGYGGQVINSNNSSIVGGYRNQVIGSDYSSIVGGKSNIVNHNHSHIIGSNITSVSANTTHVERFNIGTIDSGSASTDILVREANGMVNLISASAITTNDTFISGMTFNTGNYDLTIHRNDAVDFTQSLSILSGDKVVTGGTYDNVGDIITFTNNSGGTFNVTGITDNFVVAGSYSDSTDIISLLRQDGSFVNITGITDNFVTGGTYDINTGIVEFTNNSGGTFNVSGFTSGMTDSYTTTAYTTGNIIHFDNNIQGSDVYEVDLTPVISGFGTTNKYVESFPFTAATTSTITHNLGSEDVLVQLKDSTGELIIPNTVDNYTTNTVDINVSATETMRVIIIG